MHEHDEGSNHNKLDRSYVMAKRENKLRVINDQEKIFNLPIPLASLDLIEQSKAIIFMLDTGILGSMNQGLLNLLHERLDLLKQLLNDSPANRSTPRKSEVETC